MCMNYLVVRPYQKDLSSISIVNGDDVEIKGPFESWALNDGKKVLFANVRLHKLIKDQYLMGAFASKANYAYSYEDMCNVITSHIGPSDRVRYEIATKEYESLTESRGDDQNANKYVLAYSIWKVFEFCIFFLLESIKLVATLVIIPIIISFINKPK